MSGDAQTLLGTLGSSATLADHRRSGAGPLPAGSEVGRYVVLDLLGTGGMGAVYRAYDPELDRVVAIKLVLDGSESLQLRLQREAQAIAKLSHRNVVQVFDVGRLADGMVFIAMEYIPGMTLRAWLKREPRELSDILDVFIRAGEGLAAAHACGLIHRDFKPENVLVNNEGRPYVVDFGLAKAASESALESSLDRDLPASLSASALPLDSAITCNGARLGTPAYMPPEQHTGLAVDARSDAFSFAVALWEALYGQLPFVGSKSHTYAIAVLDGERRPPPSDVKVPRHIVAVLDRALEVDPDARYADMPSLLASLREDPQLRRRRRMVGGAAVAAVLSIALARVVMPVAASEADTCAQTGERIAHVWSSERRERVEAALQASERPFAATTAARVGEGLDSLAADWSALMREHCMHMDRLASALHDARGLCLEDVMLRMDRLASALERPSDATLEHAIDAVAALREAHEGCRDAAVLEARARRLDSHADPELVELEALLVLADDAFTRGDLGAARELAAQMPAPPPAGGWPTAQVLDWARIGAALDIAAGDYEAAQRRLLDAALLVVGGDEAALEAAEYHAALAQLDWELGDLDGLSRGLERALRLTEQVHGPDHPATHLAYAETGHGPFARGEYREALAIYRAADAALAVTMADDNLDRLTVASWIAETLDGMSRHAQAIAALEQLYTRYAMAYGATHPLTLERLESLGRSRLRAGDHEGALADLDATLAGMRADPSWRDALHEAVLLGNVGAALTSAERWDEAERRLLEALERLPHTDDEAAIHRTALEANLAIIRNSKGDYAGARAVLEACVARIDAQGADSSHNGLMTRLELARTLLELDEGEAALARLDELLERAERAGSQVLVARAQLRRARVLDHLERRADAGLALTKARAALGEEAGAQVWVESIDSYARERGQF